MVVEEVSQVEQDRYLIKAVSQCKQGAWTRWEDISNRVITWEDIWRTPQSRLSFLARAVYDTLPCPRNLSQWFGSEDKCPLCNKANAGLQHILSGVTLHWRRVALGGGIIRCWGSWRSSWKGVESGQIALQLPFTQTFRFSDQEKAGRRQWRGGQHVCSLLVRDGRCVLIWAPSLSFQQRSPRQH